MKSPRFENLSTQEQDWIDAFIDDTITDEDFDALQDRMLQSPAIRAVMRRSIALKNELQNLGAEEGDSASGPWIQEGEERGNLIPLSPSVFSTWMPIAVAAVLAFLLGLGITWENGGG